MNSSSRSLILIVAGATTLAATLGVTLGAMQSQKSQPTVSSQTIAPPVTLPQTPSPVVNAIAPSTAIPSPTSTPTEEVRTKASVASVTPQARVVIAQTLQRETCTRANMAIVNDPNPPLNVRSTPRVTSNNIVGRIPNGTRVSIVGEQNGWFQINSPVRGWIAKNRTRSSCTQMRVRISFASGRNSATVSDRIVGGGEHQYFLRLPRNQTMTVTANKGPFPTIIAPDGRTLAGDPYTDADRTRWTGRLPASGDYTLQYESNGAGFEYGFTVQVRRS